MAGELVRFPGHQVERHAGSVDQVADAVRTARSAIHDVTMDSGAYGILCQFLPGVLAPVFELGLDALHSSIDALHETAAELRTTVSEMAGADASTAARLTAVERPL